MNYLLKNCLSVSSDRYVDILVQNGTIAQIRPCQEDMAENLAQAEETIVLQMNGRIVLDGFTDGHMHLDKAFVNEVVCNTSGTLDEAIRIMGPYKAGMDRADIYRRGNRLMEMAWSNGTRSIRTHVDVDSMIQMRSTEALLDLREAWSDRIELQIVAFPQEGILKDPGAYGYLEEALRAGADAVGGIPATENDPAEHIQKVFDLAERFDVPVDMHIDETDDPDSLTILELCRQTRERGFQGRVTAGHLCSLASNPPEVTESVLEQVHDAGISLISLPSTNLYLEGRGDTFCVRRGILPIRAAREKGIPVALASDNVRDPFNPFGNANPLETALIAAHGCHMGGREDLKDLFRMVSTLPQQFLGFRHDLEAGHPARFIILDARSEMEVIISQASVYGCFDRRGIWTGPVE